MATDGNYVAKTDVDNWPSGYSDAAKYEVIQMAETLIEQTTHDYFYAKSFTVVKNGNGKNRSFLGLLPDILSITELTLSEVILSSTLYSFDANSIFRAALATAQCKAIEDITLSGSDPVQIDLTAHGFITGETGRLISIVGITPSLSGEYALTEVDVDTLTLNGTDSSVYSGSFTSGTICFATLAELHFLSDDTPLGFFPKGTMNLKVTGTYGWVTCPPAIKKAAIILCRSENDSTLYQTHSSSFKSERIGDYAYSKSDNVQELTGIDKVDKLIRNFIRKKPIMDTV